MSVAASQVVAVKASESFFQAKIIPSLAFHAARGERIGLIVGNNRLDVRALAQLAHEHNLDPRPLLARIELSRAETCHQLFQCIATLSDEQINAWHALYVLDFMENFYDETPKEHEAKWLLIQSLKKLRELASRGLLILLTLSTPKQKGREHFLQLVAQRVDVYQEFSETIPQLAPPRQLALEMGMG
ncbi:MAG: hypothetical protein B6D41_01260 [Chloroflexi bacterium UTCFX4]|nr:MAG: hypothetical protein B6D41_01260 [Chloroflexi bacterium UTCFX4]